MYDNDHGDGAIGSIPLNQYGLELPTSGINEPGLVVVTMTLSEGRYPEPDHRPYIGAAAVAAIPIGRLRNASESTGCK